MALQLVGEENHNFPVWLSNLGASFRCRFQHTGEREDIDAAIRNQEAAVRLVPAQPGLLNNLGNSLLLYFEVTGDLTDIDNAISNQLRAVELVSENDSNLPSFLSNLGASYLTRFDFKGDLQDAKSAILCQQRAVKLFSEGHPNLPGLLNNLGSMLVAQFNHTGDLEDISNAIAHQQTAVQLTPAGHANLPGFLGNLGNSFEIRFRRSGCLEDIDSAISNQQVAIQLTPTDHSNLPTLLCSIGYSFVTRSRSTGDSMDIESAIAHQQRAVQLTPKSHATASSQFLSSLGLSFAFRFERTGDPDDIESAISYQQKAVELTPQSHSNLPLRLGDLGVALRIRFERFGDLVDIERAISNQQRAVNITPQGHAALPGQLANLSASFAARFMRTGALVDIERAIATQEQAIEYMPTGHIELPVHLNNLGNSFLNRFRIKSDLQDVESALANQERAVQLTPEGHPRLAAWYNNLGNSFRTRFWRTRELPDIARAISYHQRAVDLTAEGNVYLPMWLTCLGNSFGTRFEHTEDLRDIETAISHQQRAVDITPDGHAGLPLFLHNLADSFRLRFAISKDEQDILQAISVWRRAATQNVGHPSTRLDSARRWAMLSEEHNGPDTLEAFRVAIGLLSQVAGLEQTIHSRHKSLADMSDLTASATAAAFAHGALEDALAWLEQGRCIVWNQINQLRAPVDRLRAYHPSLAGRFLQVGRALEASAYRQQESTAISQAVTPQTITIQEETHAHVQFAGDWDRILAEIRAIPGFHDFLQPPNASYLLSRLPQEGPIVIFNIGQKRSDALALVSGCDTPLHVALENFSHEQVLGLSGTLRKYLRTRDIQRDDEDLEVDRSGHKVPPLGMQGSLYKVLGSLWANAVKPILDALGFSGLTSDRPRIWWCPTGPLAFLPLHAAGIFAKDRTARSSTCDFVVSSYTPSISSLLDKLNETPTDRRRHDNLLLVSQPETPGHSRLPGAKKETEALETMMSSHSIESRLLEGAAATASQVKEELITHNWVHFACHAVQDIAEPLNSGFHLHDGRLQLLEIMQERLSKTDHAFLSACQTSMGDEKLSDEAIHLAAGMLAAGYRGVVATMWSIQDKYGPEIATTFYSHLLEEGRSPTSEEGVSVTKLDGAGAGRALDFSTQKIRETLGDGERALLAWLPYVHFGV
ncbi:hypothetical protein NLJ89_g7491 [Agrocybe chaxingu]|uniref:CHAT domain-containing protein n=1 Tax=Agrocybe chaxingu TaxID=84603 RepID=A0A9W8MVE4_9AGAR|nr:hypothetical protein NLJ89_g7491 [Agrocybe chaxingu]